MIQATFNGIVLGDRTVHYRIGRRRLGQQQEALLWGRAALVRDDSPGWVWEVSVAALIERPTACALNRALAELAEGLAASGLAELCIGPAGAPAQAAFTNYRFDTLAPQGPALPEAGDHELTVLFGFTGAAGPVFGE